MSELVKCRICLSSTDFLFSKNILGKYKVNYYQCAQCRFLQTEDPNWLEEAYNSGAISALDTGVLYRNLTLRHKTKHILNKLFTDFNDFYALDYGGGEGIFVRMMRDLGYNFYRHDLYAENLYARYFDLKDVPKGTRFNILTAFEVFEHLSDPLIEIKKMIEFSDVLLFSTELQPTTKNEILQDWWYLVPETGQHVSFYNEASLRKIADLLELKFYTDNSSIHVFSKEIIEDPFRGNKVELKKPSVVKRIINKLYHKFNKVENNSIQELPPSLMMKDFELVKKKLNNQDN